VYISKIVSYRSGIRLNVNILQIRQQTATFICVLSVSAHLEI